VGWARRPLARAGTVAKGRVVATKSVAMRPRANAQCGRQAVVAHLGELDAEGRGTLERQIGRLRESLRRMTGE